MRHKKLGLNFLKNKNMKKIIITILVVVVAMYAIYALALRDDGASTALSEYFGNRITTLGFGEGAPMPIEGYDADLLMSAFPGFMAQDFDGVESLEGKYEYDGSTLIFERGTDMPISSAERTVSKEGYRTLLANVSTRLGMKVEDELAVDTLIDTINTADVLVGGLSGSVSAFGVNIMPIEVVEDSRCPSDVNCIQAGTVRLEALVSDSLGEATKIFTLGQATTTASYEITLSRVSPERVSAATVPADDEYVFYFDIKKR